LLLRCAAGALAAAAGAPDPARPDRALGERASVSRDDRRAGARLGERRPPAARRSGGARCALRARRPLELAEGDLLRAFPEGQAPECGELLVAVDERREVVSRERTRLGAERAVSVRKEQLGLADAARVEEQLARRRVTGRVLGADPELALAPRNPVRLAAPAAVDDPVLEREDRAE